jgi:hypothetical protein
MAEANLMIVIREGVEVADLPEAVAAEVIKYQFLQHHLVMI